MNQTTSSKRIPPAPVACKCCRKARATYFVRPRGCELHEACPACVAIYQAMGKDNHACVYGPGATYEPIR